MRRRKIKKQIIRHDIRSEVTSVIAHQLKTPLVGIKSSLEVIVSGQLGEVLPTQKEYLRIALDEVERMVALVRDLLDAARIDQKELELKRQPTDLVKLVKEAIDNNMTFAKATNTEVSFAFDGKIPLVSADTAKIQQAINNIVDNAIRYEQRRGKVVIRLKMAGQKIIFSCQDSGIGIPNTEAKKIFSKFYRGRKAIELVPTGSGLGLYIARAIIEQSGGKVWFTSKPGQGSTFYFFLPVQLKNRNNR